MKIKVEEFGQGSIDRATKLLAGIDGGAVRAVKSAMARTEQYIRTQSGKHVREKYAISQKNLRMDENIRIHYEYDLRSLSVCVYYSDKKIPLYRYDGTRPKEPTQDKDKIVHAMITGEWYAVHPGIPARAHQLKSTGVTTFKNAFVATVETGHEGIGHTGIFERFERIKNGKKESYIEEKKGSSVYQMMKNKDVAQGVVKAATEKFDERMEHEITRILNGWVKRN